MDEKNKAIETNVPAIAPEGGETKVVTPTTDDLEAKYNALEAEKNRLLKGEDIDEDLEIESNYRDAYLKERKKNKALKSKLEQGSSIPSEDSQDEDLEVKVKKVIAKTKLFEIAKEQDSIIKKMAKENKELKLAQANKTGIPTSVGSHTEFKSTPDTSLSTQEMEYFKKRGWNDKDIERYKQNRARNSR